MNLWKWAKHTVFETCDRSSVLVNRVLQCNPVPKNALVQSDADFDLVTPGLETWTEVSKDSTVFNAQCVEGLPAPVWCVTRQVSDDKLIEIRSIASLSPEERLIIDKKLKAGEIDVNR